jgi:hypothetical protein
MVWVMGLEAAKSGRMPTEAEHAEMCRIFEESLDAGGCGWSAQRLTPDGPAAVQRDYDGTPMVTDVMHDETCERLAAVLGKRNEGFMQMTIASGSTARDQAHIERLTDIDSSGANVLCEIARLCGREAIGFRIAGRHVVHTHRAVLAAAGFEAAVGAEQDAQWQTDHCGQDKTGGNAAERNPEIAPQIAVGGNLQQGIPHPDRARQDVVGHTQRQHPPHAKDGADQRDPLQQQVEPEHARGAAGVNPVFKNLGH